MLSRTSTTLFSKATIIYVVAFGLGAFHLLMAAGVINISTMPMRLTHVLLAFSLLFALKPISKKLEGTRFNTVLSAVFILAIIASSVWLITR